MGPKVVAVLGGGVTGLSTAYYILKKYGPSTVLPIIFEKSPRCGGWIQSVKYGEVYYDTGPRSFRPAGLSGLNALDLVEDIGLDKNVLYVPKSHPAVKNRCIFTKGKLVRLPTDLSILFKKTPPFEQSLMRAILRDLFTRRYKGNDDSIYNFVERRFGSDFAAYGIDPLIRGICAGDAKRISVKFTLAKLFEYEQKYGSVVLGFLLSRFRDTKSEVDDFLQIPGHEGFGMSNIGVTSVKEGWALWGLENGMETLVQRLEEVVTEMGGRIMRDTNVNSLHFAEDSSSSSSSIVINYDSSNGDAGSHPCDYIVSGLPSWDLASIFRRSKPSFLSLVQLLETIEGVDVVVTSVLYRDTSVLPHEGFGFLVPSNEVKNTPELEGLLGVVFDTCVFDQGENTVLTVMSRPKPGQEPPTISEMEARIGNYLRRTLGISRGPDHIHMKYSPKCIPQYMIGHSEKVNAAKRFIKAAKIPLVLSGASFEGVSVNDCIYSGRRASESLPFET